MMDQIKRNKNKVPHIDFSLRLDSYHASDQTCLHCRKDVLSSHLYIDSINKIKEKIAAKKNNKVNEEQSLNSS